MVCDFINQLTPHSGTVITFAGLFAYVIAQGLKTLFEIKKKGYFEWNDLFDGGGMPSAHTSVVVAMTTTVGWVDGLDSHLFSLALIIAAIVIYDALNVRYHAGEQARVLNKITEKLSKFHENITPTRFKTPLGHTLPEVGGGILVGLLSALVAFGIHAQVLIWLQMLCQ